MAKQDNDFLFFQEFGDILVEERSKAGVSARACSSGIFSRDHYIRLERGERSCEKIEAEALLQRLGVPSSRFIYYVAPTKKEQVFAQEGLVEAIHNRDWRRAADFRAKYEACTVGKSKLHRQFLMLADAVILWWSGGASRMGLTGEELSGLIESLKTAWSISQLVPLTGYCPKLMSFAELFIRSLYFRFQEERGEAGEARVGYRELLAFVKGRADIRERAMMYPQLACRLLWLLPDTEEGNRKKAALWRDYQEMLGQQGNLSQMTELVEWYTAWQSQEKESFEGEDSERKTANIKELPDSLRWLYKRYRIQPLEWIWYLPFGMDEMYLMEDLVRGRREAMRLLQTGLAPGVCSVSTLSELENGKRDPERKTLAGLFDRLHVPGSNIILSAQTGNPVQHRLLEELRSLTMFSRHEKAAPILEKLKQGMVKNRFSEQYIEFELAENKRARGKIGSAEHQELLWRAFYRTVSIKSSRETLKTWIFSKTEAMILNCLCYSCEKVGKREEMIAWLRLLKEHYERQPFRIVDYMDEYELTLLNLGNLLGNKGEYEEAIELEDIAIYLALKVEHGDVLRLTLYDRAWNMEQLWESGTYTKEESRPYMKAALMLNRMVAKKETVQRMEKHWNMYYEEN